MLHFSPNKYKLCAMQYVISLDWFQYFCHAPLGMKLEIGEFYQGDTPSSNGRCPIYEVCQAQEFHAIYRCSYTLCMKGFPIAHVHFRPKSSALDPHSCALKVANRLLYSSQWSFHLHNVVSALKLQVKSITRVDLCCDLVRFANGQKPNDFIHQYVRDTSSKSTFSYIRRGSNKFCVIGKKVMKAADGTTKITDNTEIKSIEGAFDYLRFGTRQSGCSVYLYNKSLELREKHSKPWIRRTWLQAGLIKESYCESEEEPDVYRLELSIQAKGMNVKQSALGEHNFCDADCVRRLRVSDFNTQLALEETFWAYQDRYFSFKICSGQKYRKDMKPLHLFDAELVPSIKPCTLNTDVDSGVAERNAASCIRRLQHRTSYLTTSQAMVLYQASQILEHVGILKRSDTVHDLSFCLDPEREILATKEQRAMLNHKVEERISYLLAAFKDPVVAYAVENWEASQKYIHEVDANLKDAPEILKPQPSISREKLDRARNIHERKLEQFRAHRDGFCPF